MDSSSKITEIIAPSLEDMGYRLVLVSLKEGSKPKTLTVMAERLDGVGMTFDDCTEISHTAGALLEVDDPISGAYNLEVCSPGIDRPLVRPEDYVRYSGYEVKLETQLPVQGRKRFKGTLQGIENETISILVDRYTHKLELGNIRSAKLVMTDALIAEHMKNQPKEDV